MDTANEKSSAVQKRASALFDEHFDRISRRTDRLFGALMPVQWVLGIIFALTVSPRTWAGTISEPHVHLWAAIFIGGAIVAGPTWAALARPGAVGTRHLIAVGQVLIGVLFIHLTGGRIETHFHVFASLALLAFYRDWRVLVTAVVLVYIDHFVRGVFWPQSVYGVLTATPWRAMEHAGWVIAEVVFLVASCRQGGREMRSIALRQSEQEELTRSLREEIVERKRAEERIREQAALLDHARDAIHLRDMDDRILYWNRASERFYGWSATEAGGRDAKELLYRETAVYTEVDHTLLEREEWSGEVEHVTSLGEPITIESRLSLLRDDNGIPRAKLVINTDITEKKRHASRALHNQRLESIGILAGGIAHDLNNALTPILMASQLLRTDGAGKNAELYFDTIETSAERAGQLVRQVLAFACGVVGERVEVRLNDLVADQVKMAKATFSPAIQIERDLADDLWSVEGDATQLYQILMNLTVNARDAMPDGGRLTISTRNEIVGSKSRAAPPDAEPGRYAVMRVTDTGEGIPPDIIDRIFDPFFTTKKLGSGTGMGLATTLGIVKNYGGFVDVWSERAEGSHFDVFLPALGDAEGVPPKPEEKIAFRSDGRCILVIDDEEPVRKLARTVLEMAGFRVLGAENGEKALSLYEDEMEAIAAVVTDMAMPVMDGAATIRALREKSPTLRIVACSGRFDNEQLETIAGHADIRLLHKPYTADQLVAAVTEALKIP